MTRRPATSKSLLPLNPTVRARWKKVSHHLKHYLSNSKLGRSTEMPRTRSGLYSPFKMPRHGLRKIPDRTDMPGPFIVRGQRHGPCKTPEKRCGGSKMHECRPRNTPEHRNSLCKMPRHRHSWRPWVGAIKVATLLDEIACCGIAILFQAEADYCSPDLTAPLHSVYMLE